MGKISDQGSLQDTKSSSSRGNRAVTPEMAMEEA